MSKYILLNVLRDFDFNDLNLRRDSVTDEIIFNTAPIVKILELTGIGQIEFTNNQVSVLLFTLYKFHLSQGGKPVQSMEKFISDIKLEKEFNAIDTIESPALKH